MKKLFTLFLSIILLSSCGVSISSSVVDSTAIKEPYKNPLIVIPYDQYGGTKNFSNLLKKNLEMEFKNANKKVEILLIKKIKKKLTLNENDEIQSQINNAISNDNKDIVFVCEPNYLSYYNGGLTSATYNLTGIDVNTKKEVWMAEFTSSSQLGPGLFAKKSAKKIFEKLMLDKLF